MSRAGVLATGRLGRSHQANSRIINSTARKMGVPMTKVVTTVQDHGNTSAASLALSVAKQNGRKKTTLSSLRQLVEVWLGCSGYSVVIHKKQQILKMIKNTRSMTEHS